MSSFHEGAILKQNTLARLGAHYSYEFFLVSAITEKGNVTGWPLTATRTNEYHDHDVSTDCWRVCVVPTADTRKKRLPKPWSWKLVTEEELRDGVRATSCVV